MDIYAWVGVERVSGKTEHSIKRLWTTQTTNAPIEVHVAGPFTCAQLRRLSSPSKISFPSVDDLLSLGLFPHSHSHALFTLDILKQGDDNKEGKEKLEMKWLVLVCAVVMLLRSVSGKCNSLAACDDQDRGRDDSMPSFVCRCCYHWFCSCGCRLPFPCYATKGLAYSQSSTLVSRSLTSIVIMTQSIIPPTATHRLPLPPSHPFLSRLYHAGAYAQNPQDDSHSLQGCQWLLPLEQQGKDKERRGCARTVLEPGSGQDGAHQVVQHHGRRRSCSGCCCGGGRS